MQTPEESSSINIINNLKVLEKLTTEENIDMSQLPNIYGLLVETTEWTYDTIISDEIEIALQILDLLYYLDKKLDFERLFENPRLPFVVNYNIACCYQIMLEIGSVSEFMESSLSILVRCLGLPDHKRQDVLKQSPKILLFNEQESSTDKVHKLRLLFLLVKGFLQNTAVSSQLMKNDQALQNANLGKFYFKLLIFNLQYMIDLHVAITKKLEKEVNGRRRSETDNPYFAPSIDIPELKKFQSLAASSLINDFNKFCDEVLRNDPTESTTSTVADSKEMSNVILWKHNTENNERYFKKELAARSRDLGVASKMTTIGLRDFNIGNVMHIKPISLAKLNEDIEFVEYFNVKLAVEVLLTYCCCLFSIATENRFICQKEFEVDSKTNEFKGGTNESKKSLKIYKLQKNPNFIASEKYHFTAIELLSAFVEDCPLLNHLISSYQKNYFPTLEAIEEESKDTSLISHDSSLASINIQNNEYDYNKFYSHSQRDGSFIEHDEANKKSANESLGFGNGSIANIKERLFTQDDLFLEGEVQYPVSIVHFHGQSSESGMSLGVIHNAIGKLPSRGNSRVSPKTGIEVVRGLGSIVQHANHNDFVFSPSPRGNLQSNTSGLQPKDIKISGSLNIKDLGSASYSDGNELGTYSTERYDPHLAGRLHTNFKQPEPFQSKLGLNKIQKGENGLAFDGLTIGVAAKHRNPRRLVTPDRLEEHRREQVQNHFFKTSPSSSDKTDFLRDNIPLSGLEEAEDRLMASDGLQEVEHKISFQRDPDSNPNTAHKSDGRGSANSLSSSQKKSHLQRDTLPRVNTGAIDSEVLQRLEQKYMKGHRANRDSNDALQTYRKDSVGSKLRDALVNLKTKGSIAQPFKKKAQMIHLKASRGSSRNSQNSSALGKKQSLKAMDVGPQKNLVMVALNSMILKGRKESFGQHTSRQNSIKSQKLSGSSSKVASSRAGTEKDSNRLDHILNNAETVDKGSRSASHKAVRRRNVLDLNSKTREQSLAKSETGKPSSTTQKSALKIASSKISSNSTKRLFEKIFSKDKRQEGHSSDMRKHRTQVEHDVREKASEGSLRHAERSGKYSRAESKKNLELDSLIKKMYQASSGRDDLQEANRGQGMVLTDSDHRSVPSLFASKRSLFLNTLAHRQMVDESDADRRSRGKLASSRQEMSAGLDLNAIDSSKVSLMTSKTNPEKGFGFLNPEQILAKKHGKLSQSKLLQPRGHEQWVDDSRQHSARETDQRLLPVVEQEELIIHRKTIFQAGPPRAGTARSGHIREGKELSNLPRCPTESGYSTQAIIDKYSHLLKPDTANKQRSAIYPQQRLGKPASQKKTLKSAKDQKDTASISKRQEDSHQSTRADRLNKPSLLSDFIHSFDTRHKEFD